MRRSKSFPAICLITAISIVLILAFLLNISGLTTYGVNELTGLAKLFVLNIPDPTKPWSSHAFEIVTAILWDQRGLDTYFETSVLFLAIVASVALLSYYGRRHVHEGTGDGYTTMIVKVVTKLVVPIIAVVSASIAIHGHLTPGGGFQGGSVFVVAPVLMLLAYGSRFLSSRGFNELRLLAIRALSVTLIFVVGLLPVLYLLTHGTAYLFQNTYKPDSAFTYPYLIPTPIGMILTAGSIMIYNILEFFAVAAGFTLAILLLTREFERGDKK